MNSCPFPVVVVWVHGLSSPVSSLEDNAVLFEFVPIQGIPYDLGPSPFHHESKDTTATSDTTNPTWR